MKKIKKGVLICPLVFSATCDPPFLIVGTSKCVLVNNISVGSWHDMKHYCALFGAQLVKLDSASDFAALVNYINGEGKKPLPRPR